jgi:hypothetical protein
MNFISAVTCAGALLIVAAIFATRWYERNQGGVALAVAALRGRAKIEGDSVVCARPHAEAGKVVLKQSEYDGLVRNSNELTLALGYIARASKRDYGETVENVIDKQ